MQDPTPWAKKASGLALVTVGSNCLKLPAAAFLGFANIFSPLFSAALLSEMKSGLLMNTSPLTSKDCGIFTPEEFNFEG